MAPLRRSLRSLLQSEDEEVQNPLTMSDQEILEKVYATHVPSDTKFDADSLFTIVNIILRGSTHIVDNVLEGNDVTLKFVDDKLPQATFTSPLYMLKEISSKMCCKIPGDEIAHKTTMTILNLLSDYSWEAKGILTLAAFALEYGEFWWLSQLQPNDELAKSVAMLKRVSALTKPAALREHFLDIYEVNNLIKAAMQVIEAVFELQKLTSYDTVDVPALAHAMDLIPVGVYWAIITVAACVTLIDCLTTDSEQRQELSYFGQKTRIVLAELRKLILICKQQIEELESYGRLVELLRTPTEIVELFKVLIFSKDGPQELFDGATKQMVDIDVLRMRHLFLFISTLEITEQEISILSSLYEFIKANNQYKIVWIPIVEEWNDQLREKFEILKTTMPWYVVEHFGSVAGYKYIREEWHFRKKPVVVVLNAQGKVLNTDAFHLIQVQGMKAFPFTASSGTRTETKVESSTNWVETVVCNIHPSIDLWIKERKYIFLFGGNDSQWTRRFTKYATDLKHEPILKKARISIELFYVDEDRSLLGRFWSGIESLFVPQSYKTVEAVPDEIQQMISHKNEGGWVLFIKGASLVLSGHGPTILKTVAEFERWRESMLKNGFEFAVKEYHQKVKTYHEMVMRGSRS
ncbi:protein SIEVE ELEMENT OCCLUSION B [Neltuma alba]|uniref:protein SIEVE ELEMENT OCCLUSION B n=1 Tax=Neltuma alba TaxID=207710 RepID=UPI0010A4097F|nr:protein SIEVE ELEMENT OCCLUSION B-like [Prosopis alba]